ncbi:hypothetical protein BHE74_00046631 [Ensete ventricosum]|nr:hypothetical protein BHE74_00046631 [Ensete ventricosum]
MSRGTTKRGLTGSTLPFPKRPVCRIVIPKTTRGINRPTLRTMTTEGAPIHAGSLDPHRRWRTCVLGREQVELTPQLNS